MLTFNSSLVDFRHPSPPEGFQIYVVGKACVFGSDEAGAPIEDEVYHVILDATEIGHGLYCSNTAYPTWKSVRVEDEDGVEQDLTIPVKGAIEAAVRFALAVDVDAFDKRDWHQQVRFASEIALGLSSASAKISL
jgi:hypothetical protein